MRMLFVALFALFAASANVSAQPGSHAKPGTEDHSGGPGMGAMPMMAMMAEHCAMMRRTEGALAFLKAELAITAAQSQAWESFAAVYRAEAAAGSKMPMMAEGGGMMGQGMMGQGKMGKAAAPLPQTMSQRVDAMEKRLASAKKLSEAAKALYDGLSTQQGNAADELLPHFIFMRCMM